MVPVLYPMTIYIREKKSKDRSRTVIQIVENHRVGSTTKQQVLRHIGTARTSEEAAQLKRLAEVVKAQLEKEQLSEQNKNTKPRFASQIGTLSSSSKSVLVDVFQLREIDRRIFGIHDIYGALYDQIGFSNPFSRPTNVKKPQRYYVKLY